MTALAWWLVGGTTYLILGIATATLVIYEEGEPPSDQEHAILVVVLLWPLIASWIMPFYLARRLRAWKEEREVSRRSWQDEEVP